MPTILGANSVRDTGYNVGNSIRLDGTDDHFSKTLSQAGTSNKAFTFSCWIKRSKRNSDVPRLIHMGGTGGSPTHYISVRFRDDQNGRLSFYTEAGGGGFQLNTNRLFRDTTGWMHIVVAVNSADSTESNRQRMYVNGVEETSFSSTTAMSLNSNLGFNDSSDVIYLFRKQQDTDHFPGYACEVAFIDGQQLAPTAFGEFDEDSPTIWKPIDFKNDVTFGTNGFYLEFKDSSDLGADTSGNGNDLNTSLAGATSQSTDTCTNNFATLNSLFATQDSGVISKGNTIYTASANAWGGSGSTIGLSQGKWYFEAQINDNAGGHFFGVIDETANVNNNPHQRTGSTFYYSGSGGQMYKDGSGSGSYGTFGASDIAGVALNLDDDEITIYKNGSAIVTDFALSTTKNTLFVWVMGYNSGSDLVKVNFGGTPPFSISSGNSDANGYGNFEYSVPSGYYSINTKNLAEFG